MAAKWHAIPPAAGEALARCTAYRGPRVTITEQLDSRLWDQVKTILEKLGAVYVIRASAFEFQPDQDAQRIVSEALTDGRVMRDAHAVGYVPTPVSLAAEIVDLYANLPFRGGQRVRVLEPSAGTGPLVAAVGDELEREWVHITAVEPDTRRAQQIERGEHVSVVNDTFEDYFERARSTGDQFDLVVMNPPFAVPGRPNIWVDHLLAAWQLVTPGGRLVAIVPSSVLDMRGGARVRKARELVHLHGKGKGLDANAFAESGIGYPTAVVWLDRLLTDMHSSGPSAVGHPSLFRTYSGEEVPVVVARPFLTRGAAKSMPVQAWRDPWAGSAFRVLRYRADCVICELPVWAFDDGENDPRGILGENSATYSIAAPASQGEVGTPVGVCATCGDQRKLTQRARELALELAAAAATGDPPASACQQLMLDL